ncbi:glycosyltransferase [bacterium]|nr:glycosyltransferase [bacterium]MCB2179272.1 glycosyltransferase [bacterium]
MAVPPLSIAVVSSGQKPLIENLLASLAQHRPERAFHVYVLENIKGQPVIIPSDYDFPVTYWQNESSLSLSKNLNQIFHRLEETDPYFCILNPDIVFVEEVFSTLIRTMESEQIDLAAPLIFDSRGEVQDSFRPFPRPVELVARYLKLSQLQYQRESLPEIISPDWIAAMFMLMPAQVYSRVGGFDPNYPLYFEDVDFCLRAKNKGMRIGVVRDVQVVHDAQRSSHQKVVYLIKHLKGAMRFFRSGVYRSYRRRP